MKQSTAYYAFNRGVVSPLGLARADQKRVALSAETMTNWIPRVLGSMSLRPGWKYLGATKSNNHTRMLPFVFSTTDTSIIELTDTVMRVWDEDALVTRPAVTSAVANGNPFVRYSAVVTFTGGASPDCVYVGADNFAVDDAVSFTSTGTLPAALASGSIYYVKAVNTGTNTITVAATRPTAAEPAITMATAGIGTHTIYNHSFLTSWTDNDETGAYSEWATPSYMALTGTGTSAAIRDQTVTVIETNVVHALHIYIERGPVTIRVGTSTSDDSYVNETVLETGYHSLAFTPTGDFNIRFLSRQVPIVYVGYCYMEAAGAMEITTPWLEDDLDAIRADQSGDVVFIACKDYQQRRIERRDNNSWSVVLYKANDGPFMTINTSETTITAASIVGNTTLTSSQPIFRSTNVGGLFQLISTGQTINATLTNLNDVSPSIRVTGVSTDRTFSVYLTGGFAGGRVVTLQYSLDDATWISTVTTYVVDTATSVTDGQNNQIVYYRVRLTTLGAAGNTASALAIATGSITGVGRVTSYTSPTVVNVEVVKDFGGVDATVYWSEGYWSDRRGWPTCVVFHEGRLWWAGAGNIWGSVSDAYDSFDPEYVGDAGPLNRKITKGPVDVINFMMSLQRMIVGTQGFELSVKSSALDDPLTPTNFTIRPGSGQGSANVQPIQIDQRGMYVQRGGLRVYELSVDTNTYDYTSTDITALVPELGSPGIVHMVVQRQPDTRIHCIRSDGTVMIGIYDKTEEVLCWCDLETNGLVEDAVVLPSETGSSEDRVYYVVNRTINGSTVRYLEKWAKETECRGSTLNLQADSYVSFASTGTPAVAHLEGEEVVVWQDGFCPVDSNGDIKTYTVSGGTITLDDAAATGIVGLAYTAQWKSAKIGMQTSLAQSIQNDPKRISKIGLIAAWFHPKGITYGPDFTNLDDMPEIEDGYPINQDTVRTAYDQHEIVFPATWSSDSRLCVQAQAPRPVTLLSAKIQIEVST